MSHSACKPVKDWVLGQELNEVSDSARLAHLVARNRLDLLQAQHTGSGVEIALWDLLGRTREVPVWHLPGHDRAFAKTPYALVLFGDTPQETLTRPKGVRACGFVAAKFGWGSFGALTLADDLDQLHAAREGPGPDGQLLVDAGQLWGDDLDAALRGQAGRVGIAAGEAAHSEHMARHKIDDGHVQFIQIDCGRIGGIGPAKAIAEHAARSGVTYVNHTFTLHLALNTSLQPYAGHAAHHICEFPAMPKPLALDITTRHFALNANGQITLPDAPGLGMTGNPQALRDYHVPVEILVRGKRLYWGQAFMTKEGQPMAKMPAPQTAKRATSGDHLRGLPGEVINRQGQRIVAGPSESDAVLPGDAALMPEFAVSRTSLREAITFLSAKGLVESRQRVGTVVRPRRLWNVFDSLRGRTIWRVKVTRSSRTLSNCAS